MKNVYLLLAILLMSYSCSKNKYLTQSVVEKTRTHKTVAFLPTTIITRGTLPRNITDAELQRIKNEEAIFFQKLIRSSILQKEKAKNPFWVNFLTYEQVANKLKGVEDVRTLSLGELEERLDVDAVVFSTVVKDRYMSEPLSAVIGIGKTINDIFNPNPVPISNRANTTYDITLELRLIDMEDGSLLYNRNVVTAIDYRLNVNHAVKKLGKSFGKKFPYREYNVKN